MTFDLEKARKIVGAMSPTPWIVLEDRYGQIDVIRNPNHPMHKEGVIELWGMTSETATPDAIGISYMRSEFPNALDEIERLRGFETAARDLNNDLTRIAGERDDLAAQIQEMQAELVRVNQLREIEIDQAGAAERIYLEAARLKDARIDELEADNQNLVTLNKSLMNNDWILRDNNRKYRKRAQKAELLNKELKADLEQSERVVEARLDVIDQQAAKIRELEDVHKRSGMKYAKIINELRSSVYANIPGLKKQWDEILNAPANGKIGPDAKPRSPQESDDLKHCHSCGKSIEEVKGNLCKGDYFIGSIFLDPGQEASRFDPPIDASYYFSCCDCARSWQITDERVEALWHAIKVLKENDIMEEPEEHLWDEEVTVLQAMMKEADHDKP